MAESKAIRLQCILADYATTLAQSNKVAEYVNALRRNCKDETDLERNIVGAIYDGLAYGNWPWTKY